MNKGGPEGVRLTSAISIKKNKQYLTLRQVRRGRHLWITEPQRKKEKQKGSLLTNSGQEKKKWRLKGKIRYSFLIDETEIYLQMRR